MTEEPDSEGLEPIASGDRSMGLSHYVPVWWSSMIVVQSFAVAFFAIYPQGALNLVQAIIAVGASAVVVAIFFILNGFPGYEEGIPFSVQTRSSFGTRGAKLPNFLRIIPAIAWLGIGNWIGALGINVITTTIWGFGNLWIYFGLFTVINIALSIEGITSIKWFDSIAAGVIIILMSYTVYVVLSSHSIPNTLVTYHGTWGLEFYTVIAASVGTVITGAMNASDMSRHLKQRSGSQNHIVGHFLGLAPPLLFMMIVGLVFGIFTGNPNPIKSIMAVAPNPILGSLMLIFVLTAQISTNLTMNILPPTHVFQDSLGISWKSGVILTGVLSVMTFPWLLFTSQWFFTFVNFYSMFLGPAIGVMIADYWFIRKRDTDVEALYNKQDDSPFWFWNGFSVTGILGLLIGAIASLPLMEISWMIGLPVSFVSYIGLKKVGMDELFETSSQQTQANTETKLVDD
jgi:NCS1 family nucleobase:cation symporter-1